MRKHFRDKGGFATADGLNIEVMPLDNQQTSSGEQHVYLCGFLAVWVLDTLLYDVLVLYCCASS